MKLRNQLLALFCLLLFVGAGVLYFRAWVVQKPFGIILFTTDLLDPHTLTAARMYEGGADHRLTLDSLPHVALLTNHSHDAAVPDVAAAASALATGTKVPNGVLSVASTGASVRTLLEQARQQGRAVGIVTTGRLGNPGAAAFFAHTKTAGNRDDVLAQLVDKARLDLVFGGGAEDFLPQAKSGTRADNRDLLLELKKKNIEIVRSKAEMENTATFRTAPIYGLFASGSLPLSTRVESGSQQPSLSDMVRRAIQILQLNAEGYVLVVDAALAGEAAQNNEGEQTLGETLDFDRALGTAMRYSGEGSLILAAGRVGLGGMSLSGNPLRQDNGVALLGTNAAGNPGITWASGPKGPQPGATPATEPAAFHAPLALPVAGDVLGLGTGKGSEKLHGFLDNTVIFEILREAL